MPSDATGGATAGDGGSGEILAAAGGAADFMDVEWASGAGPAAPVAEATYIPGGDGVTVGLGGDGGAPGGAESSAPGAGGVARQLFHEAGYAAGDFDVLVPEVAAAGCNSGENGEALDSAAAGGAGGDVGSSPDTAVAGGTWEDNEDAPLCPDALDDAGGTGGGDAGAAVAGGAERVPLDDAVEKLTREVVGFVDRGTSVSPDLTASFFLRERTGSPARTAASLRFEEALALAASTGPDIALWVNEAGVPINENNIHAWKAAKDQTPCPLDQGRRNGG